MTTRAAAATVEQVEGWSAWSRFAAPAMVLIAGLIAYSGIGDGVFLFDDLAQIINNTRIRDLSSLSTVLSKTRPVVDLTLAVNYAYGDLNPRGYLVVNLAVHLAAALTLLGVVRRTLLTPRLSHRYGFDAHWMAFVVALVWVVHPLQTQSVNYCIQRAESMMALFYLLTLYCVIRGAGSSRPVGWYVIAIVVCALGMGSKAVMATAPIVILAYDRIFLAASWRDVVKRRWPAYAGLTATLAILFVRGVVPSVLGTKTVGASSGFSLEGTTPLQYALTQFGVLVEYLKLSLWPYPLCLDYQWPTAETLGAIAPAALVIVSLVAASFWLLAKRPAIGFVCISPWLVLAPTSTIIPIKDAMFEHRMYLPLAGIVTLVVIAGAHVVTLLRHRIACSRMSAGVGVAIVVGTVTTTLVMRTARRTETYQSKESMWRDVVSKRPNNARALQHLGTALVQLNRRSEAIREFRKALVLEPDFVSARMNLGNALMETNQPVKAERQYRQVARQDPEHVEARTNLGHALDALGRSEEAMDAYREATEIAPQFANRKLLANAHYNLGSAVGRAGDLDGALTHYELAVERWPKYERALVQLAYLLNIRGRPQEALPYVDRALAINPENADAIRQRKRILDRLDDGDRD